MRCKITKKKRCKIAQLAKDREKSAIKPTQDMQGLEKESTC